METVKMCPYIFVGTNSAIIGVGRKLLENISKAICLNRLSSITTDLVMVSSPRTPLLASLPVYVDCLVTSHRIVSPRIAPGSDLIALESYHLALYRTELHCIAPVSYRLAPDRIASHRSLVLFQALFLVTSVGFLVLYQTVSHEHTTSQITLLVTSVGLLVLSQSVFHEHTTLF